jgi:hypothetical protein
MFPVDAGNQCESIDLPDAELKYWASIDLKNPNGVAKQAKPCGPRINLTFRRIIPV